jgi:hypothetical protein
MTYALLAGERKGIILSALKERRDRMNLFYHFQYRHKTKYDKWSRVLRERQKKS